MISVAILTPLSMYINFVQGFQYHFHFKLDRSSLPKLSSPLSWLINFRDRSRNFKGGSSGIFFKKRATNLKSSHKGGPWTPPGSAPVLLKLVLCIIM